MEPRRLARGAASSLACRAASQLLQLTATVVLGRLVAPEAFGLVAMAASVTGFVGLVVEAGVSTALVQQRELLAAHVDAAFALTAVLGVAAAGVAFLGAPAVAAFFGQEALTGVTRVGAAAILLGAIAIVPRALLVRALRVRRVALIDLAAAALSVAASIALAVAGAGVWAIAATGPVAAAVLAAGALLSTRFRPTAAPTWAGARPLLAVGLPLLGFSAVNYWARNIDNVLIGLWLGDRELGFYTRAYTLMLLPVTELTGVLTTTMLPALSRLQADHPAARSAYLRVLRLVTFAAFPAMIGLAILAGPFVRVVFGPAWSPAAPILRVLAVVGALQAVVSPIGWLYQSQGRTDRLFRWGLFASTAMAAAIAAGAWRGSGTRVAACYLAANVALLGPAYRYARPLVGLRVREVFRAVLPSAAATACMATAVAAVELAGAAALPAPARLAAGVATGVLAYAAAARLLRVPAARELIDLALAVRPGAWRGPDPVLVRPPADGEDARCA